MSPGEGDLARVRRRPKHSHWMLAEHWVFVPENRRWDADDREMIAKAIGLHALNPEFGLHETDDWWKRLAREYHERRDLMEAVRIANTNA